MFYFILFFSRRLRDTDTQREEGHGTTKAKIGVVLPQAQDRENQHELEETRNLFRIDVSEGAWPC